MSMSTFDGFAFDGSSGCRDDLKLSIELILVYVYVCVAESCILCMIMAAVAHVASIRVVT